MRHMVDPPEGWKFGFPKEMKVEVKNTHQWLIDEGYPKKLIDAYGAHFYCRHWMEPDGAANEMAGIPNGVRASRREEK